MRILRLLTTLVLVSTLLSINYSSASADGEELRVDNDQAQCPGAHPTIQSAVTAAAGMPGRQKIRICPGTYTENVVINDPNPIEIFGDGIEKVTVRPVPGTSGPAFQATNSGYVSIEKLTVDGMSALAGNSQGIRYDQTSGLLKDLVVVNIRDAAGAGQSAAIRINSTGAVVNARVEDNRVENWTRVGVMGNGPGVNIHIEDNLIVGPVPPKVWAPNGVQVSRGAVGLVKGNEVRGGTSPNPPAGAGSGILLFCAGPSTVEGNKVFNSDLGISLTDNADGRVIGNEVRDSVSVAYSLEYIGNLFGPLGCPVFPSPTTNNLLEGNKAFNSGEYGVSLASFDLSNPAPPTNNRIINTDIKTSGIDGIRVFEGQANYFINNTMENSVEHDAHDDQFPTNIWEDNDCKSPNQSQPPGLCKN